MTDDDTSGEPPAISVHIPMHELLGLEFDAPADGETTSLVTMPVRPQAFGFTANLHGGAIATLVDVACALAAAKASGFDPLTQSLVTADMHLRYLGRPRTDHVHAKAEVLKVGRQLIVVTCQVVDDDDHIVAAADFSCMIVPLRGPIVEGHPQPPPGAPEL
jgi:uncharacterized protein (TIGR00369 family)